MDPISPPQRSITNRLAWFGQAIVFTVLVLLALISLLPLEHANVPGMPLTLIYGAIAASSLVAVAHFPKLWFRYPSWAKRASYAAALGSFLLVMVAIGDTSTVWEGTPEGAKEAATRAEADRQRKEAAASEAATAAAQEQAAKVEALEGKLQALCESLVPNVIALSKEGSGPEVIEINEVTTSTTADPKAIACSGKAITSSGDRGIDFGARQTPQGKDLVTMQLN